MVELVALLEAAQDLGALLPARLLDQHLLKTAIQGRILLHRAAVVLRRGGADAAQIAPGQHRFEDAARIGAGAVAAHDRVQFIDEQDHAGAAFGGLTGGHLHQHAAQPFLELAAELGAGDQGPQVEGDQPLTLERIGHLTGHDSLGQQFGNRRFAHAGLPDQHRIVLAPARQHLDQAADCGVAADHRSELAGAGGGGEIAAVGLEGAGFPLQAQAALALAWLRTGPRARGLGAGPRTGQGNACRGADKRTSRGTHQGSPIRAASRRRPARLGGINPVIGRPATPVQARPAIGATPRLRRAWWHGLLGK